MNTTKTIDPNTDPILIEIVAKRSGDEFESRYANLLSCFDIGAVFNAIASFLRLQEPLTGAAFTVPAVLERTEEAMRQLIQRGALNEFQRVPSPIPSAAQEELDRLFGVEELDSTTDAQAAQSARQALIAEAARDWRSMGSREYKQKWMNTDERRAISEAAWAQLEAQDRAVADGHKSQRESREREAHAAFGVAPLSPRNF